MNLPKKLGSTILIETDQDQQDAILTTINHDRKNSSLEPLTTQSPSIHWINLEKEAIKIKTVRTLIAELAYSRTTPEYYCLLDAHKLTLPAQNALLKSLEEPPSQVMLVLSCQSRETLLETIQSRCQILSLRSASGSNQTQKSQEEEQQQLSQIVSKEYGQLLEFAEQYSEPTLAQEFLLQLIQICEGIRKSSNLSLEMTSKAIAIEQKVLRGLQLLTANCSARLVVECTLIESKTIFEEK